MATNDRIRDSAELPERMRRDVRLLGDVLGEVISESGGAGLLADVERLRHAVIDARRVPDRSSATAAEAADAIAALVGSWSRDRAEQVAGAFTVYFHLVNLAEEQQRVRTLRHRASGDTPPRESLADAAERITAEQGRAHLDALLGELVVHPVFTAHPTEARRRAVVASLRRIGGLLASVDDDLAREVETGTAMSSRGAELRRRLREEIDLLWRTAQLRVAGMTPLDEVRTVMTAFDETLFRLVPSVYRSLDQVLLGPASGAAASPVPPFLRFGSWVGGDRDGNPTVTAAVTREAAVIQAEHALRALEAACGRIGRALTVDERAAPPSDALRRALAAASAAHPELMAEITARSPGEPYRAYLLYAAERLTATRTRNADLDYGSPAEFVADLRLVQAVAGGRRGGPAGLRRAPAPDLAGRDVRFPPRLARGPAAFGGARPRAGGAAGGRRALADDARGARDDPGDRLDPAPVRVRGLPPVRDLVHHRRRRRGRGVRAGRVRVP